MSWNDLFHILCEKIWLIISFVCLFLFLGILYLLFAVRIFEAASILEVEQREKPLLTVNTEPGEDYRNLEILKTIEGSLTRPSIILRILARPDVAANPYLKELAANPQSPENKKSLDVLNKSIKAKLRRNTRLIDVTVEHRDPATAQMLCNAVGEEYIRETFLSRSGVYQNTSQFLVQESRRQKEKLQSDETQLQQYGKVVELRSRIRDEQKNLDALRERYLEKHPKIIQSRTLLASLQDQFVEEMKKRNMDKTPVSPDAASSVAQDKIEQLMAAEESRYNVLMREIETDRAVYDSLLQRLKEANVSQGYEQINVAIKEHALLPLEPSKPVTSLVIALSLFLGLFTGTCVSLALYQLNSSFRTVDFAEEFLALPALAAVPEIDNKHRGQLIFEAPYGRNHYIDKQLRRLIPLFNVLRSGKKPDKTIFQQIRQTPDIPELSPNDQLVMLTDASSIAAESFRSLRATLRLAGRKQAGKTFLFTSAIPGEGKSFTAANYAVCLAQEGHKVLLIDADLRRPTLHEKFNIDPWQTGLTDVLAGEIKLNAAVRTCFVPNLGLLTSGGRAPNPAELLSGDEFNTIIQDASAHYDKVIVDSAPVNAVSDTLLICNSVHGVCLIIRAGTTPRMAVLRACKMLGTAEAKVIGFVLNRMPARAGFGANPYYYHYHSGEYGQAYGSDRS